jgi:transposase
VCLWGKAGATVLTHLFFPGVSGLRVDRVWREEQICHITLTTTRHAARCPLCQRRSKRVHSHYQRVIGDLPCGGSAVVLHLQVRRFVCRVRWCRRTIFTERLPTVVAPSARRTTRLQERLLHDGFDLGGAPGARHATAEGMPVSRRTLLRLVRAAPTPAAGRVRVVGIDDWASKRGRTYGTIVVNLETHRVIDVLPDRTAATVATWLAGHPEIEVVSRDRAGAYAEAARQGAPQATQIADRFHLLKNVTEALERYLARKHAALRQAAAAPSPPAPAPAAGEAAPPEDLLAAPAPAPPHASRSPKARLSQERRARRVTRYEEVMALHATGASIRAIASATHLNKRTILRFIHAETFPELQPRAPRTLALTPFLGYLRARWDAGCHNAQQLWQEIRAQGYPGGRTVVAAYLHAWRVRPASAGQASVPQAAATTTAVSCAPRHVCWLLLRPPDTLAAAELAYLTRLYHCCPQVAVVQALVKEFATVLREQDVAGWYAWLHGMEMSGIAELAGVARSMRQDRQAIEAAITQEWSNGVVEGKVNKLKVTKRVMYGRATFEAAS